MVSCGCNAAAGCWCGETATAPFRRGVWRSGARRLAFELGRCVRCGTIRTTAFGAMPAGGSDASGDEALYSALGPRHHASLATIEKHLRGPRVLDIGCNTGLIIQYLQDRHPELQCEGVDTDAYAVSRPVAPGLALHAGRLEDMKGPFNTFLAMHVLEHVDDLGSFCRTLAGLGAPGARLCVAVPNIRSFNARFRPLTWGALSPGYHRWHFSPDTVCRALTSLLPGWKPLAVRTSWVWPYRPFPLSLINRLFDGDQIELVMERETP